MAGPVESPLGVLNHGKSYLKAADHLCDASLNGRLSLPFDDPVTLLLGHSLELNSKACLTAKGATEQEAWGHDLVKLRDCAVQKGCNLTLQSTEVGHLTLLNKTFGQASYTVRYLQTGSMTMHDDKIVLKFANRFANEATTLVDLWSHP